MADDFRDRLTEYEKTSFDNFTLQGCDRESIEKFLTDYEDGFDEAWDEFLEVNPHMKSNNPGEPGEEGDDNEPSSEEDQLAQEAIQEEDRLAAEQLRKRYTDEDGNYTGKDNIDELSQEETGETEEIESDTLTDEEKAERDYPYMAKDGMPYRQDFTHKEEPDEELKKMYPDMNVDDL